MAHFACQRAEKFMRNAGSAFLAHHNPIAMDLSSKTCNRLGGTPYFDMRQVMDAGSIKDSFRGRQIGHAGAPMDPT
ncbi:hypothetical protein ASE07_23535 [Noviherbaspirillum sp. Root189]|nr:hypothetical protein ASE07_23535 [Noviherbaspirillum sp. Root189]